MSNDFRLKFKNHPLGYGRFIGALMSSNYALQHALFRLQHFSPQSPNERWEGNQMPKLHVYVSSTLLLNETSFDVHASIN